MAFLIPQLGKTHFDSRFGKFCTFHGGLGGLTGDSVEPLLAYLPGHITGAGYNVIIINKSTA